MKQITASVETYRSFGSLVKQQEWYTCGPACLRMLLKYLGTSGP